MPRKHLDTTRPQDTRIGHVAGAGAQPHATGAKPHISCGPSACPSTGYREGARRPARHSSPRRTAGHQRACSSRFPGEQEEERGRGVVSRKQEEHVIRQASPAVLVLSAGSARALPVALVAHVEGEGGHHLRRPLRVVPVGATNGVRHGHDVSVLWAMVDRSAPLKMRMMARCGPGSMLSRMTELSCWFSVDALTLARRFRSFCSTG